MDGHGHPSRIEAERLIGVAEKLLFNRDLNGSREFALLAQETDPLLEVSDQILAIIDVLLASERRVNNHQDWYSILQIDRRTDDQDLIKRQYRRLAMLLHPDKNKFPFADHAFRFVAASWAVLSDPVKKTAFDRELNFFTTVDLTAALAQQVNLPVHRRPEASGGFTEVGLQHPLAHNRPPLQDPEPEQASEQNGENGENSATFWTTCPFCFVLHEYPSMYEDCCLKCQECGRAFHGVPVSSLPPLVPGQDAYRFCWGAFQLGFMVEKTVKPPPPPPPPVTSAAKTAKTAGQANAGSRARGNRGASTPGTNGSKKRGRPRKYA